MGRRCGGLRHECAVDRGTHTESGLEEAKRECGRGGMSKEESNYGRERERGGENPPRIDFLLLPLPPPPPPEHRCLGKANLVFRLVPRGNFSAIRKLHPTNRDEVTRAAQCTLLKGERRLLGRMETRET